MFGLHDIDDPKVEDNVFVPEPELEPKPENKKVETTQYIDYRSEYTRFKNGAKDTFYNKYDRYDGEHLTKFRARAEYFYNKDNGLYATNLAKTNYGKVYKNYLKNKTLI